MTNESIKAILNQFSLYAGICVSLIAIYQKGWRSTNCELGSVSGTDLYVDLFTHHRARAVPGIRIYRHIGPINFAFSNSFKRSLYQVTSVTHKTLRSASIISEAAAAAGHNPDEAEQHTLIGMRTLIIDLSCVSHIDVAAVKTFQEIQKEMELLTVQLILAAPNDRVFTVIKHAEWLGVGTFRVMPSIHDAVLLAKSQN